MYRAKYTVRPVVGRRCKYPILQDSSYGQSFQQNGEAAESY